MATPPGGEHTPSALKGPILKSVLHPSAASGWVEEGIRRERIFDKRAKVALVVAAWAVAVVTIWLVLM